MDVEKSSLKPVDVAWVEARVQAIQAVEPFVGRPIKISWLELPVDAVDEGEDRKLPILAVEWPENTDGWSDEWTFAIPPGGEVAEYLEAVRDPLGL